MKESGNRINRRGLFFDIFLKSNIEIEKLPVLNMTFEFDPELKDIITILDEICDRLSDTDKIDFIIKGFGEERWPVDIWCDLPVLLEQLPEAFENLKKSKYNFEIDFYEQGVQRKLIINGDINLASIKCKSETEWIPEPEIIEIEKTKLSRMLKKVFDDFLMISNKVCPALCNEEVFVEWEKNIKKSFTV